MRSLKKVKPPETSNVFRPAARRASTSRHAGVEAQLVAQTFSSAAAPARRPAGRRGGAGCPCSQRSRRASRFGDLGHLGLFAGGIRRSRRRLDVDQRQIHVERDQPKVGRRSGGAKPRMKGPGRVRCWTSAGCYPRRAPQLPTTCESTRICLRVSSRPSERTVSASRAHARPSAAVPAARRAGPGHLRQHRQRRIGQRAQQRHEGGSFFPADGHEGRGQQQRKMPRQCQPRQPARCRLTPIQLTAACSAATSGTQLSHSLRRFVQAAVEGGRTSTPVTASSPKAPMVMG